MSVANRANGRVIPRCNWLNSHNISFRAETAQKRRHLYIGSLSGMLDIPYWRITCENCEWASSGLARLSVILFPTGGGSLVGGEHQEDGNLPGLAA